MAPDNTNVKAEALELVIERTFDAPRHRVYQAWTDPELMAQWSAPHDYSITHNEGELRPGGAWRSCMHSPEGEDLWLGGVYREVVPDELLVLTHAWDGPDGKPGHETVVTVKFADNDGKTLMTFRQTGFESAAGRDGHNEGWGECFDRLAVELSN